MRDIHCHITYNHSRVLGFAILVLVSGALFAGNNAIELYNLKDDLGESNNLALIETEVRDSLLDETSDLAEVNWCNDT